MSINATNALNQRINGNGQLERELTAQIAFPKEVQFIEAADLLEQQFGSRAIHGIMPLGGNRMQITFNTPTFVSHALTMGLKCRDQVLEFKEISRPSTWITVRNCPLEMSSDEVGKLLSPYGTIEQNFKEMDRRRGWFNGNRKLKMKMTTPIPNILKIGIYPVYISYEGVEQLCRRCYRPNHQAYECTTPFCHRCKNLGHLLAECPKNKIRATNTEEEKQDEPTPETQESLDKTEEPIEKDTITGKSTAEDDIPNWADDDSIEEILREEPLKDKRFEVPEFCQPSLSLQEHMATTSKSPTRTTERTHSVSPDRSYATATKLTRSKSAMDKPFPYVDKDSERLTSEITDRKLAQSNQKNRKKEKKRPD